MTESFKKTSDHSRISPTAKFVAQLRAEYAGHDNPYFQPIAELCQAQVAFREIVGDSEADLRWMGVMFEARYRSINVLLERYMGQAKIHNVLELAAGLSPREIEMTTDSSVTYVATDLPEIITEKEQIVEQILPNVAKQRPNLHFVPLNVLDDVALANAVSHFPAGKIAVVNEGLLMYLERSEKERIARNIHNLLTQSGGVWITPDASTDMAGIKKRHGTDPKMAAIMGKIASLTTRDMRQQAFADPTEARTFFTDLGFKITEYNQHDLVPDLAALRDVSVEKQPEIIRRALSTARVWVMEV